jgi:hypothetical protein
MIHVSALAIDQQSVQSSESPRPRLLSQMVALGVFLVVQGSTQLCSYDEAFASVLAGWVGAREVSD